MTVPVALTIAGSDSGGGAGIQADLKVFAVLGVHGAAAITAVTAQNTLGVRAIHIVPSAFIAEQIDAVATDLHPSATKTGMLGSSEVVHVVADRVRQHRLSPLVVDPVLAATTGHALLSDDGIETLRRELLPLAAVVTPNIGEAQLLSGRHIRSDAEVREAARAIQDLGPGAVVVTGGHREDQKDAVDILFDGSGFIEIRGPWIETRHTHGSGCAFASAIAASLALGHDLPTATARAKDLVAAAITGGLDIGAGNGPVNPLAWRG